jgi:hypothetical protein
MGNELPLNEQLFFPADGGIMRLESFLSSQAILPELARPDLAAITKESAGQSS